MCAKTFNCAITRTFSAGSPRRPGCRVAGVGISPRRASTARCTRVSPPSIFARWAISATRTTRRWRAGPRRALPRAPEAEMAQNRPPRPEPGTIASVLYNVRRAPKRVRRQSRDFIETAVSQLFDAATRHPHGLAASGEYRIDDLARLAGTTTRNIRLYRARGLLPPPLRVGRIALFNDTHLTRLRLITSLLDRGYNIAHVHEMLSAWEQGKDLGSVLGLESAIAGTWAAEKPQTMTVVDARRLINDDAAFDRLVGLGVIRCEDGEAVVVRPKLIEAFNDIRQYGVTTGKLIDLHEQIAPLIDQISGLLV